MGHTRTSIVFAMVMAGGLAASLPAAAAFDDVRRPPLGPPTEQSSAAARSGGDAAARGGGAGRCGCPVRSRWAVRHRRRCPAGHGAGGRMVAARGRTGSRAGGTQPGRRRIRPALVFRETEPPRSPGIGEPPIRAIQPPSCTSAKRTRTARASRQTPPRPCAGGARRRTRETSSRKIISGRPTTRAKALRWTSRRRSIGIVLPPNRDRPQAQSNLGFMYQNGQGVARDPGQAVQWWRRAAAGREHQRPLQPGRRLLQRRRRDGRRHRGVQVGRARGGPCVRRAPAQIHRAP